MVEENELRTAAECLKKTPKLLFRSIYFIITLGYFLFKVSLRIFFRQPLIDFTSTLNTILSLFLIISIAFVLYKIIYFIYYYRWWSNKCKPLLEKASRRIQPPKLKL